jgi:hypothetical protein
MLPPPSSIIAATATSGTSTSGSTSSPTDQQSYQQKQQKVMPPPQQPSSLTTAKVPQQYSTNSALPNAASITPNETAGMAQSAATTAFLNQLGSSGGTMGSNGSRRKRRHRTIFTEEQLQMLEQAFNVTQYPGRLEKTKRGNQLIHCQSFLLMDHESLYGILIQMSACVNVWRNNANYAKNGSKCGSRIGGPNNGIF